MNGHALISLLPPVFVLLFTVFTRRINLAFALGIILAALIASGGLLLTAASIITSRSTVQIVNADNIYQYLFLFIIGMLISFIDYAGGARAFARVFTRHINSARAAENAVLVVTACLGIDDFLSNSTAGFIMRPITDSFAIARAKLAYLVHAVATPLIMILPISTWLGFIAGQLGQAGITPSGARGSGGHGTIIGDPFFVFLNVIPFIFYSIFALVAVIFVVQRRITFGPMKVYEHEALEEHFKRPVAGGNEHGVDSGGRDGASMVDFVVPIATLIATFVLLMLYTGGYHIFGGTASFIGAFKNSDQSFLVMLVAGVAALVVSILIALPRAKIAPATLSRIVTDGIVGMARPVAMLVLASILADILRTYLHTGAHVASLLGTSIPISCVPCAFFVAAAAIAILLGTSWGTILLLLPMATPVARTLAGVNVPIAAELVPLLYPILGAVFAGAICGDHASPISQSTIMSSTSAGVEPTIHTKTQLPLVIPTIAATALAFLVSGLCICAGMPSLSSCLVSLVCGIAFNLFALLACNALSSRRPR